jgi:hypothetical protein
LGAGLVLAVASVLWGCSDSSDSAPPPRLVPEATRGYAMGFSWLPPRPDQAAAQQVAEATLPHSDAALILVSPPWTALLGGTSAEAAVRGTPIFAQAAFYRGRGLPIVISIDPTNGLDRAKDADELVRLQRSLVEPAVQQVFRDYVRAVDQLLRPEILGIASETNLVRDLAPALYRDGLKPAVNAAAADLRAAGSGNNLLITVQVEQAWGAGRGAFVGIDVDRADFAFANAIGLSSYPYLGGFSDPDAIPLDYYDRLVANARLPLLFIEGGWPSDAQSAPVNSSPEMQRRYIRRQAALLDNATAVAWFQISFTDLDTAAWGPGVAVFSRIGLADATLAAKPALADWDELLRRRRVR